MTTSSSTEPGPPADPGCGTARRHLARLAEEVALYGLWARVFARGSPFLRVSNPRSVYATEDVHCAWEEERCFFRTSFGVDLGEPGDAPAAAHRIARLLGRADPPGAARLRARRFAGDGD